MQQAPVEMASERRPLGEGSDLLRVPTMREPIATLTGRDKLTFYTGHSFARNPWVAAPSSTTARDGLGPLFNARSCTACHINGGRSNIDAEGDDLAALVVRLGIAAPPSSPADHTLVSKMGRLPEPTYGGQLQPEALGFLGVAPEAAVNLTWTWTEGAYPDGQTYQLRAPKVQFDKLGYGPFHHDTATSLRIAPALAGTGFVEAIDEADILANADPDDRDGDGISGKANVVWNIAEQGVDLGRFGWKAAQPTVRQQTAAALLNDMGITSALFPNETCTAQQTACEQAGGGGENNASGFEIDDKLLDAVTLFSASITIPTRTQALSKKESQGRELFYETGCNACHQPSYVTPSELGSPFSEQHIWPYSDFLLHDMGAELADNQTEFLAQGSEWRTAPLWGLATIAKINPDASFLHDGRARDLEEAILWHGGEAQGAQQRFKNLTLSQRQALIEFLWQL